MVRRLMAMSLAGLAMLALLGCGGSSDPENKSQDQPQGPLGGALYTAPVPKVTEIASKRANSLKEIVVDNCRIVVINKQDVPSLRDGVIKEFKVKEGDLVKKDDVLVELDDRLPHADVKIKEAKAEAAKADALASEKTRDESYQRWQTQIRLLAKGATSVEDVRAAELTYVRYQQETVSKKEGISLAREELNQANVVLGMHKLQAAVNGRVKTIYRKNGESVKNLEPVLQLDNIDRLRVEAMVDRSSAAPLRSGWKVIIEPNRPGSPLQELPGHGQEVTSVAVNNSSALIVSASEDATLRVWQQNAEHEWRLRTLVAHAPGAVRAVACTPEGVKANLCLSAAGADGRARLWDLDSKSATPLRTLDEKHAHRGAVTCVAFAPDGKTCATGGEDREIRLWDVATGALRYTFPAGHRGAVTSLQFTPDSHLVSAGRDNSILYWSLHEHGAQMDKPLRNRSGDVFSLGVSPDGKHVLSDHSKTMHVVTLENEGTDGLLNSGSAANFTTFAQFSPDGRLIVTAGGSEGRLQLWQTPTGGGRGHELLQLSPRHREPATCCAFAPNGKFLVTGSKDHHVVIWDVPAQDECAKFSQLEGTISFKDESLESASKHVRVWVDFDNPRRADGEPLLNPGDTATIAIDPSQK